jgi:hypothetical protein
MTQLAMNATKPNATKPIDRFARVDGQWEVAGWWSARRWLMRETWPRRSTPTAEGLRGVVIPFCDDLAFVAWAQSAVAGVYEIVGRQVSLAGGR